MSEGQNVDISFVSIMFYEVRVFSQMRLLKKIFETLKGEKRTWAHPMGSKQGKSLYEIDNFTFLLIYMFLFFEQV